MVEDLASDRAFFDDLESTIADNTWTSTVYAPLSGYHWTATFGNGTTFHNFDSNSSYVRCVR